MLDVAKEIVEEDGIGGLWNGIKVNLFPLMRPSHKKEGHEY